MRLPMSFCESLTMVRTWVVLRVLVRVPCLAILGSLSQKTDSTSTACTSIMQFLDGNHGFKVKEGQVTPAHN
jgi:hypothetical protein